jgi:hypothetical protein
MPRRTKNSKNSLKTPPGVGISELFDRCAVRTCRGSSIRCCLGLWSVSAPDAAVAEREARHYWQQYYADGEYEKHLSNPKVSDGH